MQPIICFVVLTAIVGIEGQLENVEPKKDTTTGLARARREVAEAVHGSSVTSFILTAIKNCDQIKVHLGTNSNSAAVAGKWLKEVYQNDKSEI
uniref:Uncharacterized protein n=1 Tax=Globodera rostochiensis TaxID=31243 RepID=A0A914GYX6_GLORO